MTYVYFYNAKIKNTKIGVSGIYHAKQPILGMEGLQLIKEFVIQTQDLKQFTSHSVYLEQLNFLHTIDN